MNKTTITISQEVSDRLKLIKIKHHFKNSEQTINYLIESREKLITKFKSLKQSQEKSIEL